MTELYRLTASEIRELIRADKITVKQYAQSLLGRVKARDDLVQAWAYLDPELVLRQAIELDGVPKSERGPLHGVAVGVKDVMYTKDMPTQHNSSIYEGHFPAVDAGPVMTLRQAGALIFGKTTTTEFAAVLDGPKTHNAHAHGHTPGGSSSGSGAAVGDMQVPIALGTQTGGSTIRPGSYNGIFALKPTWASISREGLKLYSPIFDTLGLYARSVADLQLLADVFQLIDDEKPIEPFEIKGAKFAMCKTVVWPEAGPGTIAAMELAAKLLTEHGAEVGWLDLPAEFAKFPALYRTLLAADGRVSFLGDYKVAKEKMNLSLIGCVENVHKISRKAQLEAFDKIAALRPAIDEIAGKYAAIVTPSVPDEAPKGISNTGSAAFCSMWTALHVPVVNIPGFSGSHGLPIGLSFVAPRYHDRHLLSVSKEVGKLFINGGWKSGL